MNIDDNLFLIQYQQVWEQRRHHVKLFWGIPAAIAVMAFIINKIDFNKLDRGTMHISFILFIMFSWGAICLFLRHNFFIATLGRLLQELENKKQPLIPLPQFGDELKQRYISKIDCWAKCGSKFDGMNSWGLMGFSIGAFLILLWADLTNISINVCQLMKGLP